MSSRGDQGNDFTNSVVVPQDILELLGSTWKGAKMPLGHSICIAGVLDRFGLLYLSVGHGYVGTGEAYRTGLGVQRRIHSLYGAQAYINFVRMLITESYFQGHRIYPPDPPISNVSWFVIWARTGYLPRAETAEAVAYIQSLDGKTL